MTPVCDRHRFRMYPRRMFMLCGVGTKWEKGTEVNGGDGAVVRALDNGMLRESR